MTQLFEESSSNLGALPGGTAVEVSEQGSRFEPGDIPSAIAGAAEELLGWYPEIPLGGESEGRARPRVWRGKKTVGKGGLRPPGAFLHQLALTLRLAAWAAIFKRFSPEPVAGILIAVGLAFGLQGLPTRSRRVGALRFWLPMVLSIPVEAAVLTLVSRNYLVPRYPETWLRFLLLAVAVLLAARCLDLAGVWLEMRKRVAGWRWARVPEPDLTVSRQGTPEAIAIVPRARSRFRRMPKPEKVEQFSDELRVLLDTHRRAEEGEDLQVSRLQRLSTIFAPFYPRGAAFQELSDLLSDEEISQDEVRKRVRFLLAVPEEVLRRPPPSLGRGAEMGLALSGR